MKRSIGLKRLTVKLFPHNPRWSKLFQLEKKKLNQLSKNVEHIGSTSIKGIKAKPVIDILFGIPKVDYRETYIKPLDDLGYILRKSFGRNHLFFVKGNERNRTHYLHLVKYEGKIWNNDIFFRDYLNTHKSVAKKYEALKIKLGKKFAGDRIKYTSAKEPFIRRILNKQKIYGTK